MTKKIAFLYCFTLIIYCLVLLYSLDVGGVIRENDALKAENIELILKLKNRCL